METLWDEAIQDPGNDAGAYTDSGEPKGLLHTTEGKTYSSAKGAYVANNSWPHFTVTYETSVFRAYQHNPINLASRALKNLSGGVETNRDRIIQIEIVGTADTAKEATWGVQYVENFPKPYLDGIGRLMRWCEAQLLIPRICTLEFLPYPASYGANGVRLSGPAFDAYTGWLGHMHAAENDHGDPGLIDIVYLLNVGVTPVPTPPLPLEGEMHIIRKATSNYLFTGSALLYLPTNAMITEHTEAGYKVVECDDRMWSIYHNAYPSFQN